MTQLKRANPTTHGACSKCTQPTSNRTGMCVPCRTQICTKCVKPFLPKVPSSICGYCRSHKRRKDAA